MKILSFGSCNIDYVYSMPHIITPGETLSSLSMAQYPGGKGFNQGHRLGARGRESGHGRQHWRGRPLHAGFAA